MESRAVDHQIPGTNDVSRVTSSTITIAVVMPNTNGILNDDWRDYRVSVDSIESLTGYDFFSNLTDAAEGAIEAVTDSQ